MLRMSARLAFPLALALLALGGVGFARAAALELDALAAGLPASAAPGLLGPINELGRNGWNCLPERAAVAKTASAADLPTPPEP